MSLASPLVVEHVVEIGEVSQSPKQGYIAFHLAQLKSGMVVQKMRCWIQSFMNDRLMHDGIIIWCLY